MNGGPAAITLAQQFISAGQAKFDLFAERLEPRHA